MSQRRVGLWLIGAFGGVGTTAALGLAALGRGLTDTTSLVTALPLFDGLDLDEPAQFVVGGHDIRRGSFRQTVRDLQARSNVFEPPLAEPCLPQLDEWEANVRPGTVLNAGDTIRKLADLPEAHHAPTCERPSSASRPTCKSSARRTSSIRSWSSTSPRPSRPSSWATSTSRWSG